MIGSYQSRHLTAQQPALATILPADLTPPTETPGFAALEASTMGTLGTPADGWHPIYDPVVAEFANEPGALAGLDTQIKGAGFTPGLISSQLYSPIGNQIASTTPGGTKQLSDFDNTVNGGGSTSGGGSGGSGGGGGCTSTGAPPAQQCTSADWGGYTIDSAHTHVMPSMHVGTAPTETDYIWSNTTHTVATLLHGDPAVFSLQVTYGQAEGYGPPLYDVILSVHPAKSGHFGAVVQVHQDGQPSQLFGICVDIGGCSSSGQGDALAPVRASVPLPAAQLKVPPPRRG